MRTGAGLARLLAESRRCRPADGREWQLPTGLRGRPAALSGADAARDRGPDELRLRARLCGAGAAEGAGGRQRHDPDPRRGALARLHRQDLRARAGRARARPAGRRRDAEPRAVRRMAPARCRGRWRRSAISRSPATSCASASRCRPASRSASLISSRSTDGPVDYAATQNFRRVGDTLIAELQRKGGEPASASPACWRSATGSGLEFQRGSGHGARTAGRRSASSASSACSWAVLGALAGGILLNLMPCVFPILALKALHLARAGGDEREARRDALGLRRRRRSSAPGALGVALLAIRAGGSAGRLGVPAAGPAHDHAAAAARDGDHRSTCSGLFELPVLGGRAQPAGSFGTGALAAFVATPCAGPFLGAALGTALLLPSAGSVAGVRGARPRAGAAVRADRLRSARCADRLPKPGPWMAAAAALPRHPDGGERASPACGCSIGRPARRALVLGLVAAGLALHLSAARRGRRQRGGKRSAVRGAGAVGACSRVGCRAVPSHRRPHRACRVAGAETVERSGGRELRSPQGKPVFVYFTADWCLTCKVNEAAAIDRDEVRDAFRKAGVKVLAGDWTNGDPAITRFLESRGRAGVPLYLWYAPGKPAEELPQVLTPGDAYRPRSAGAALARAPRPSSRQPRSRAPASAPAPADRPWSDRGRR